MLLKFYQLNQEKQLNIKLLLEDYFLDILNLMLCYLFMKWEPEKHVPLYKQLNKI
ncbi:028L [Invertebrate iridescent virus 6]|uniref:028L n=1 Tax=Invertebrate iridescent virus 6 TaxID=176652 RepID=Q91G68_IIV6|nr:028L [Invertebrate iridescent virus 6]AAK81964.1 028L [Invertebrate iridescent virus 6]QMS79441.1 hypothetical protein IIV6-T1_031 [Invertebrate iridescent virus 6]